jgi:hypothetical protein
VQVGIFNISENVKVKLAYFDVLRKNFFMESGCCRRDEVFTLAQAVSH